MRSFDNIDWTTDPNNPDEVADTKAAVVRWCSLFERHTFLMDILVAQGFRPRSIELLATHPVWIAKVAQGSAFLAADRRMLMRDLRALFRATAFTWTGEVLRSGFAVPNSRCHGFQLKGCREKWFGIQTEHARKLSTQFPTRSSSKTCRSKM